MVSHAVVVLTLSGPAECAREYRCTEAAPRSARISQQINEVRSTVLRRSVLEGGGNE